MYLKSGRKEWFNYPYDRYGESKDDLLNKVCNIRKAILKLCNADVAPVEVLGGINLKKEDGE
jgi:hypothetical protein